ncbi:hypothetical protein JPH1_35430 [Mycobacterium avium subsp. hominissuis]|uniref:Amidohydrolase family protein n=1 Tax=Mycobacterium avium subsp. hominissuis TaxID=439334 RepID=A0AAI8X3T2_MYCAV|nr:hypothetical protein JPH1_35430 [Mycobacterium avium subsp. hominissuis]
MDRYTVISADCHAGADLLDYRDYLDPQYRDEFDGWAKTYVNPFGDLSEPDAERNWNSARRNCELDTEGIAGEVIYPNTVPPFFPHASLAAPPPETARELELRWAGLRAHNRWLADFCSLSIERRAGVGQILLGDLDEAVAEVAQIAKLGLRGGVLLPGIAPAPASRRCTQSTGSRCGRRAPRPGWWSTTTAATPGRARPTGGAARSPSGCTRRTGGRIGRCGT